MFNAKNLGQYIALLRRSRQMTQQALAEKMHVTHQAVSSWERGESVPDVAILSRLATALGASVDALLIAAEGADFPEIASEEEKPPEIEAAQENEENDEADLEVEEDDEENELLRGIEKGLNEAGLFSSEFKKSIRDQIKHAVKQTFKGVDEKAGDAPPTEPEESKPGELDWDKVRSLAPFLSKDKLSKLVLQLDVITDLNRIRSLAPFLDRETLDTLIERATERGEKARWDGIRGLAPFLSRSALDQIVSSLEETGSFGEIRGLAPFLTSETLERLINAAYRAGEAPNWDQIRGLAPFASKSTLETIVLSVDQKADFGHIRSLAPFLDADTLEKLLGL